jgi:hypothetical protein
MACADQSCVVRVVVGSVVGTAVGGAVVVPLGHMPGERHVAARHLQEPTAFEGITQALGRLQAALGHSLIFFTRGHETPQLESGFILKMRNWINCSYGL